MWKCNKCNSSDIIDGKIVNIIDSDIFEILCYKCVQPERSKREDYNYKCLELDGNSSVDFVEIKRFRTKLEAENWVDEKPHLRTWHEFVDAVL